jgi:hypothetical protein
LWQSKVEPDLQGRVFAVRRWIAQITAPLGMLIAGPLADWIFEPAMQTNGIINSLFGWIVGAGPGAGMATIFLITGSLGVVGGLAGYLIPVIRNAEAILPDHDVDLDALLQEEPSRPGISDTAPSEPVSA